MSAGKGSGRRDNFKAFNQSAYWDKADPQQQPTAPRTASGGSELSAERRGRITRKEIAQATGIDWEAIDPLKEKAARERIDQLTLHQLVFPDADTFASFMATCTENTAAMFGKKRD